MPNRDIAATKAAVRVVIIVSMLRIMLHIRDIDLCYSHPGEVISTIRNFTIKAPRPAINERE